MKKKNRKRAFAFEESKSRKKKHKEIELTGTFKMSRHGFGFVELDNSCKALLDHEKKSILIPGQFIHGALDGDSVCVNLLPPSRNFDDENRGPAGRIVKILNRKIKYFVARVTDDYDLEPLNNKLPPYISPDTMKNCKSGDYVKLQLTGSSENVAFAKMISRIGKAGVVADELDAIMVEYNLLPPYTEEENNDAMAIEPLEIDRQDRTNLLTLTIDPFDAKDFDDAISIADTEDDSTILVGVHIADVAAYIPHKSQFDIAASKRGFTSYLPGRTLPMLPAALTAKISLQEGVNSLVHTIFFTIEKATGKILKSSREHSIIKVDKRLSYDEVQDFIDKRKEFDWSSDINNAVSNLIDITQKMRKYRKETEEFLDIPIPEVRIICNEKTNTITGIANKTCRESENIIEECMLAANSAIGQELSEKSIAGIYRTHQIPDPESILEFNTTLNDIYNLGAVDLSNRKDINKFINNFPNTPGKTMIMNTMLRAMPRATYEAKANLHFALGKPRYVHFTSPIRRYTDLSVHQQLWNLDLGKRTRSKDKFAAIAENCSYLEKNNDDAYYAANDRLKLLYLDAKATAAPNNQVFFDGVVCRYTKNGILVYVDEIGMYGNLEVPSSYTRKRQPSFDDYNPNEERGYMSRKNYNKYSLGLCLKLQLSGIDFANNQLYFIPVNQ